MKTDRHRRFATLAVAFVAAFAVGALGGAAAAGTATSSTGYFTVNGIQYSNRAAINTNPANNHQAYAVTVLQTTGTTIPTGWGGANSRLFTSGGALSCESGWIYNSAPITTSGALNPTSCFRYQVGTWYSYGVTRGWNGSSYNSVYTYTSPNQNS